MYLEVLVKILAVRYNGESREEIDGPDVVPLSLLARTSSAVERNFEAAKSDMKIRLPIEVLVGDPQSIR